MAYKRPYSVLVVVFATDSGRVLMLQRRDMPKFWQSITGSLESTEKPVQTAVREVKEEIGVDIVAEGLNLIDRQQQITYEIFQNFRHRYAPGVEHNVEHWFALALPSERELHLTEHLAAQWLPWPEAAALTCSWSNREAIETLFNTK